MATSDSFPIVLTADRTLMAAYDTLLDGMIACSQTTAVPQCVMDHFLLPRVTHTDGAARLAPVGLRRIEAALIESGRQRDDIIVVDDDHLQSVIGSDTQVVAITCGEPLGRGMSSTTMQRVMGGTIYPAVFFEDLLAKVQGLVQSRAHDAATVLGGPGAWQIANRPRARQQFGIDHIVTGYAETEVPELFDSILSGEQLPPAIESEYTTADAVPPIQNATIMGGIEIGRGCGLGCEFCAISDVPMGDIPQETIISDVETNVSAGLDNIALLSEDALRYGADGVQCRPEKLLQLLRRIRSEFPDIRLIQMDHANIASVCDYSEDQLAELVQLLCGPGDDCYPWMNLGVESASGRLVAAGGCRPKMRDIDDDNWGEFCSDQLARLQAAGFVPLVSLIIALPNETREDVERTLQWVRSLRGNQVMIFPVIHAPLDLSVKPQLNRLHWRLIRECYEFNFRWVPRVYWRNQSAAGGSKWRRLAIQVMSRLSALQWRLRLMLHSWRASE